MCIVLYLVNSSNAGDGDGGVFKHDEQHSAFTRPTRLPPAAAKPRSIAASSQPSSRPLSRAQQSDAAASSCQQVTSTATQQQQQQQQQQQPTNKIDVLLQRVQEHMPHIQRSVLTSLPPYIDVGPK